MIPRTLAEQIGWLANKIAEIERRARNRKRTGVVSEVDNKKGLARVKFSSENGQDFLSAWIPWKEVASGGIKSHIPPTTGEQVDVVSESGDMTDAIIDMSSPSNANQRPHDGPEAVITKGNSRIFLGDNSVDISSDVLNFKATTMNINADVKIIGTVDIDGSHLKHNDTNVGSTHVHGGVERGGANTSKPQ